MRVLVPVFILLAASCGGRTDADNVRVRTASEQPEAQFRVPGEYLVTVNGNAGPREITDAFKQFNVESVTPLSNTPGVFLMRLKMDPGLEALKSAAAKVPLVKAIQPNFVYHMIPSGPGAPQ
ncbi:MAG: hypothetical protein HY042_05510 [Spirochaetia bacterium]|nr:hypothetical protein [Spirochaetia bacterium]